jgi:hypothetical protein
LYCGKDEKQIKLINELASNNVKRTVFYDIEDWAKADCESPYFIEKLQEVKTTWHPMLV